MLTTIGTAAGRFANIFFQNIAVHFIAKKYNIYAEYYNKEKYDRLGIDLYTSGALQKQSNVVKNVSESNIVDVLMSDNEECSINLTPGYFQTREFCIYLKENMDFQSVIDKNCFKDRYNTNNDVFVHVRLGDIAHANPGYDYYDSILNNLIFQEGFISSDSPNNPIVIKLIQKYNLKLLVKNKCDTVLFGSTCKHIVLSHGTFSWLIGFLGIYSSVYFPKIKTPWHGDIFVFPEWKEIDY